jgi:hypothetical protein
MGYVLQAVLGSEVVLRGMVADLPDAPAVTIALGQGVSMVPMTDELFDAVTEGGSEGPLGFWKLPGGFDRRLAAASHRGPVAYVEAEFFGGTGTQRAVVWMDSGVSLGPLWIDDGEPFPEAGTPISQALRALGVDSTGRHDEFAAVGLGAHRNTEDRFG